MATISVRTAYGEAVVEIELPTLDGSDKQIAWAGDMRERGIRAFIEQAISTPTRARAFAEQRERFEALLRRVVASATTAKVWIDARGNVPVVGRALGITAA